MKILTTSSTQSIKFIPRVATSLVTLKLTNKNTRISTSIDVSVVNSNGYMTLTSENFNLKEGTNYSMEVSSVSSLKNVIYRDTIFCTNQTDYSRFDVHKNEYVTEDTFDNEFIVL